MAKNLNQYFVELSNGITPELRERLFSDGLLSVLITIYKYFIAFIIKKPVDTDLKNFLNPLLQYFNSLDNEGIKTLKKNLSSEGGKLEFRNQLIRVIQDGYNKGFGVGIFSEGRTLAELIGDLEFPVNKWVNSIMEKAVGKDWINNKLTFTILAKENL